MNKIIKVPEEEFDESCDFIWHYINGMVKIQVY